MTTFQLETHRISRRSVCRTLLAVGMCFLFLLGVTPASAGQLGVWYELPRLNGVIAGTKMTYLNSGSADGEAGGFLSIRNNNSRGKYYVQYKPDPRGPGGWNRGTPNVRAGQVSLNNAWHDDFTHYTTGYKFRICKVRPIIRDKCGTALLVEP